MSNAWGHIVRVLTEEEVSNQIMRGKHWHQWVLDNPREGHTPLSAERYIALERKCRISKKCQNESTHLLKYKYITGRAGRASFAEKQICEHHAKKYLNPTT